MRGLTAATPKRGAAAVIRTAWQGGAPRCIPQERQGRLWPTKDGQRPAPKAQKSGSETRFDKFRLAENFLDRKS